MLTNLMVVSPHWIKEMVVRVILTLQVLFQKSYHDMNGSSCVQAGRRIAQMSYYTPPSISEIHAYKIIC